MRRICFVYLFLCLIATFSLSQSNPVPLFNPSARVVFPGVVPSISVSQADPKAQARVLDSYGKLPLSFEGNHGQADGQVKFLSRTQGYTLFLTGDEAVLAMRMGKAKNKLPVETRLAASPAAAKSGQILESATGAVLRMKLHNANAAAKITGTDELAGTSNYFIGNDPAKWRTNVPTYAKVKYEGIYSGIDLVYYGNQRQLEYDFIVAPGADPRRIAFEVRGAKRIKRDKNGDLVMQMATDEICWHKPLVYQEQDGVRQLVATRYVITDTNRVGFEVAKYDPARPLYIDPLVYSTYLGGSGADQGNSIAVDSAGNAYVIGSTDSFNFPTANSLQATYGGQVDAFVAKINASGSALVYSTYLGGGGSDWGFGIAVDSAGNACVTGSTDSSNFPTVTPLQPANAGGGDGFVSKLNPTGSALVYSTYLSGSGRDGSGGIAVDSAGNAYVTGLTGSSNFPTKNPLQATNAGGDPGCACDSFVSKINSTGALVYSTYLGGSGTDYGSGIAVDSAGNAYVTGSTDSINFPTQSPLQASNGGGYDAFVFKLNPSGSALVYSTYLGGHKDDYGNGIAVDSTGNAHITGGTLSIDFPKKNALQKNNAGKSDAFVSMLDSSGMALVYSTYLGGSLVDATQSIAVDSADNAYVTGYTESVNFRTSSPLQATYGGGEDAIVAKINNVGTAATTTTTLSSSPNPSTYGQSVTFIAVVTSSAGPPPDGETVTFIKGTAVLGTGTLTSGSASFTTSTFNVGTNSIAAEYVGDSKFAFSLSKPEKQVVNKAATTTTLASSLNPSNFGQSVTFTATVTPQFGGTVKGSVTFYDGATALKTVTLSGGVAKFITSTLSSGAHTITATYNGSTSFDGSSASLTQTVN